MENSLEYDQSILSGFSYVSKKEGTIIQQLLTIRFDRLGFMEDQSGFLATQLEPIKDPTKTDRYDLLIHESVAKKQLVAITLYVQGVIDAIRYQV